MVNDYGTYFPNSSITSNSLYKIWSNRSPEMAMIQQFQTILCTCSIVFDIVAAFGCQLHSLSATLLRPRQNSKTHRCTNGNEDIESFNMLIIFV